MASMEDIAKRLRAWAAYELHESDPAAVILLAAEEIERLAGRVAYLTSVKDASRMTRMRLAEENLWLRELAGIAPDAEVPRPPKQWTPEGQ